MAAYRKARRGKRSKHYVGAFELNLEEEILRLRDELEGETYRPSPLHRFVICDPKTRVIHAPAFRDRVVHHAVCNILEPIFERSFIFDSYASRKGKGTHAALERFEAFKRRATANGRIVPHARDSNMVIGWALKADIRHYFPSVDHGILLKLLERKVSDRRVLRLLRLMLESHTEEAGRGMPLGALTSQLFANIYLNPLDHFVKEKLGARFYIRYMDDFMILGKSMTELETIIIRIEEFLDLGLGLKLHPEKSRIFPLHRGVELAGFRIFYHYRLPKRSNLMQFLRRLAMQEESYRASAMTAHEIEKSIAGWLAHAAWGDTYRLRRRIADKVSVILTGRAHHA